MARLTLNRHAMAHQMQTNEQAFREKIRIVQSRDATFRKNKGKKSKISLPQFSFQSKQEDEMD